MFYLVIIPQLYYDIPQL